jgi:hypothetical protein
MIQLKHIMTSMRKAGSKNDQKNAWSHIIVGKAAEEAAKLVENDNKELIIITNLDEYKNKKETDYGNIEPDSKVHVHVDQSSNLVTKVLKVT